MKKRKVRKPKEFRSINKSIYVSSYVLEGFHRLSLGHLDLKTARKFHAWLTKAIKYLEQK